MIKDKSNFTDEKAADRPKRVFEQARPIQDSSAPPEASVMDDEIELERREAYTENTTQNLLRYMLENENEDIIPTYHPNSGFTYETVEPFFEPNTSHEKITENLERLARLDIIKKSFFDAVLTCPSCKSTTLTMHYRCPKCKSHHIDKTSLTEHIPCGYMAERERYIHNRCPKCNRPLTAGEYRDMGRWFVCQECSEKIEDAESDVICRKCGNHFLIEEAKTMEIPKFSLNIERKKEIRQSVASLDCVNKLLLDIGFDTEMPGTAIGEKSGMNHHFSLIAKRTDIDKENTIAIDHAVAENEVQAPPLILYLYKISEVKVDLPIFVALPKLSEGAKKIAQGHKILLIEGSIDEESIPVLKQAIEARLNQINQPPPALQETKQNPNGNGTSKNQVNNQDGSKRPQAQLFDVIPTIHPEQQSSSIVKKLNFMNSFKKTNKKDKDEN